MRRIIRLLTLILLVATVATAQEPARRPKIGVALSGGGARGFAHIGVLRWFEEHRIPIDYVAGTSMGGLIGGLYATGMSPQQLEDLSRQIDWNELLRPVPPYSSLSFRRKEDRREFPNHLELGLNGGVKIPPGLNSGHAIGLLFDRLTLPYSTVQNFDDLPIPFRCIATDMVQAKQVVLSHGPLASALQATMAIPGVFSPIELDGSVFVSDGGLLKNIPTDTAEDMGADVVIAVDIGTPLGNKESLQTLTGVLSQTISVMMEESTRRSLDPKLHPKLKTVISPPLGTYKTFDFSESEQIVALGYQGAEKKAAELLPYSLSEAEWNEYIEKRRSRIRTEVPVPEFVEVTGIPTARGDVLRKDLAKFSGKPLSTDALEASLNSVWGHGQYAGVGYSLIEKNGQTGLLIFAREKGYAPPVLNIGLSLNNTETDVFDFSLQGRATFYDLLFSDSEARLDASIGSHMFLGGEYYKRLFRTSFFVAPYAAAEKTKTGLFSGGTEIAQYEIKNNRIGIDFGYSFGSISEVRLGYQIANASANLEIGDPVLPNVSGKYSVARLLWQVDSTDSAVIPTHGVRAQAIAKWIFDSPTPPGLDVDSEVGQAAARGSIFLPAGAKNTIVLAGEGGSSFGYKPAPIDQFTIGGLLHVSGLSRNEFRGNHVLYYNLMYLRKVGSLPPILGEKISIGGWYEGGSAFNDWDQKKFYQGLSAGMIVETLLGPIFVGGSWAEGGRSNFFFAIGRLF